MNFKQKLLLKIVLLLSTTTLAAAWQITNNDHNSYELIKKCGSKTESWSIAGKVTKSLSIPAGATSCTITVKKNGSSCTVKDGGSCTIQSGKISGG